MPPNEQERQDNLITPSLNNQNLGVTQPEYSGTANNQPENNPNPLQSTSNPTPKSKKLSLTALILGIVAIISSLFLVGGVFGLLAIIFGLVAIKKHQPKTMAVIGIILGFLALVIATLLFMIPIDIDTHESGNGSRNEVELVRDFSSRIIEKDWEGAYNNLGGTNLKSRITLAEYINIWVDLGEDLDEIVIPCFEILRDRLPESTVGTVSYPYVSEPNANTDGATKFTFKYESTSHEEDRDITLKCDLSFYGVEENGHWKLY